MNAHPAASAAQSGGRVAFRRFLVRFAGSALLFEVLFVVVLRDSRAFSYWLRLNAYLATRLLGGLGMQVSQDGATLRFHGRSLEILGGCDGLEPAGLYALALLLYPAPVRRRLLGLGTGLSLLLLVNLLRIVTLVLLFSWNQRVFNEAHHWGWPVILTVTALLLWFLWTRAPRHDP